MPERDDKPGTGGPGAGDYAAMLDRARTALAALSVEERRSFGYHDAHGIRPLSEFWKELGDERADVVALTAEGDAVRPWRFIEPLDFMPIKEDDDG